MEALATASVFANDELVDMAAKSRYSNEESALVGHLPLELFTIVAAHLDLTSLRFDLGESICDYFSY